MKKIGVSKYYFFGTQLRFLQDAKENWSVKKENYILDNITRFLKNLEGIGLDVTRRAAYELDDFKKELEKADNEKLTATQASALKQIMKKIRWTLDAEIEDIKAFITTPKRYSTETLLSDIGNLFAPSIFDKFPDIAKYDFNEAGKCIVYERPTAAAFHILRATEANLRHYYKLMVKQKRIASGMWGPIVQDLIKRKTTKKHSTLNGQLDNIRVSFRNPTQHPEAIYDIHESQDLLAISIDVNNRMFKVLEVEGR